MNISNAMLSVLVTLILSTSPATAEEGDKLWQHSYGGGGQDWGYDAQVTADGGFILVGFTSSMGNGGRDVYLVKLNAAGDLEWEGAFGTAANDIGQAVIQTVDGGFLVAGNLNIGNDSSKQGLLIKLDAEGMEEWQETYGGLTEDQFFDVVECAAGGFAMVGVTTSIGPGGHAAWIVKVDSVGTMLWQNAVELDGHGFDYLTTVVETAGGDFVAGGYSGDGVTFPTFDAESAKFDAAGDLIWRRTYDASGYDRIYGMTITTDGSFAFAGVSSSAMTIWRTDANGIVTWIRQFQTITNDTGLAVIEASDGGFLIGGSTWNYDDGAYQMYVGKSDADGEALWERLYGGDGNEGCYGVCETPAGDYALVGTTNSIGAGGDDLILILVEGPRITTGIVGSGNTVDRALALSAYPNPFNPATSIAFDLPEVARVNLVIFDFAGRQVRTLLAGELVEAGHREAIWRGLDDANRKVAAGVYFYRLEAGSLSETRRMTLVK